MTKINRSVSVEITALFVIIKAVGITRSEPSPCGPAQEVCRTVPEVGKSHSYDTLGGTRDLCHVPICIKYGTLVERSL
jgi:hypothetical protein